MEPLLNQPAQSKLPAGIEDAAALENFLRLQQFQKEYLDWLEANTGKIDLASYVYQQIR